MQAGDPTQIGPYKVIGLLGAGGMGRVYLGHRDDGVTAAVKVINEELAQDESFRARFRREVVATRAVTGRYVAAVIDYDVDAEQPWLATEYVPSPSLHTVIVKRGPLDTASVREAGAHLAEALAAIHSAGLVHRDVKPGNILLSDEGPRLIDFGIARGSAVTTLTQTGAVLGTPQYMAPEQLHGRTQVGPAADIFALGLVLAFAATGHHPFGEDDSHGISFRIVYEEPRLETVPDELVGILRRCLAKEPEDRPTPSALATALRGTDATQDLVAAGAPDQEPDQQPDNRPTPDEAAVAPLHAEATHDLVVPAAATPDAEATHDAVVAAAVVPDSGTPTAGSELSAEKTAGPEPAAPPERETGRGTERGPSRRVLAVAAAAGALVLSLILVVALGVEGTPAATKGLGRTGTPRSSTSATTTPTASASATRGSSSSTPARPKSPTGSPSGATRGTPGGATPSYTPAAPPTEPATTRTTAPPSKPTTAPVRTPAGSPPPNMTGFDANFNDSCIGSCNMPLTLTWSAVARATYYDIRYTNSTRGGDATYSTGGTGYTIDGPVSGDNVCVSMRAGNAYGASAWTQAFCGMAPY